MKFAERIKNAIKESGYTQKQIAQLLHISESNITNWKRGENLPSVEILYKLCLILGESSDYLIGLEDDAGSKTYNTYNNYGTHNGNNNFRR